MALTSGQRTTIEGKINTKVPDASIVGERKRQRPRVSETLPGKNTIVEYGQDIKNLGRNRDEEIKWAYHYDPSDKIHEVFYGGTLAQSRKFGQVPGWKKFQEIEPGAFISR